MDLPPPTRRVIDAVLATTIMVDLALAIVAIAAPQTWFQVMHHGVAGDALHQAFLARAAGSWAALAGIQVATLRGWRRWPGWLLIAAGARLSDALPDLFYLIAAPARTAATWGLAGAPLLNVALALFLIAAARRARRLTASA
jgi:hypothetical protein